MEQQEQITRVRNRIAKYVAAFMDTKLHQEFRGIELHEYVARRVTITPGSADRILRDLRRRNIVNYRVIKRSKSLYLALPVEGQLF